MVLSLRIEVASRVDFLSRDAYDIMHMASSTRSLVHVNRSNHGTSKGELVENCAAK